MSIKTQDYKIVFSEKDDKAAILMKILEFAESNGATAAAMKIKYNTSDKGIRLATMANDYIPWSDTEFIDIIDGKLCRLTPFYRKIIYIAKIEEIEIKFVNYCERRCDMFNHNSDLK
jgi:hypothetical protein